MPITHTFNLNANQTPTPQAAGFQLFKQNSTNPGIAPNSTSYVVGDTLAVVTKFNQLALGLDIGQAYGGGGFGIFWGLGLTESASGLTINVAAGQANIKGVTDLVSGQAIVLPANLTSYLYLLNTTAATYVASSLTPPSAYCVYLGAVTTNASGITGIDDSGVVYIRGNHLVRKTADTSIPTDSPPSNITIITIGPKLSWEWNGSAHLQRAYFTGNHLHNPYTVYTASGTVNLAVTDSNIQRFIPTGATTVVLPASGLIFPSNWYMLANDGTGFNLTIKDNGYTIATILPGYSLKLYPKALAATTFTWPTTGFPTQAP